MVVLRFLLIVFNVAVVTFLIYRMLSFSTTHGKIKKDTDCDRRNSAFAGACWNIYWNFCPDLPVLSDLSRSDFAFPLPDKTALARYQLSVNREQLERVAR